MALTSPSVGCCRDGLIVVLDGLGQQSGALEGVGQHSGVLEGVGQQSGALGEIGHAAAATVAWPTDPIGAGDPGVLLAGFALLLLLGLAVDHDPEIAALADEVERLAGGEFDVEFPADREDEIGRLSEALEVVGERLRRHEERAAVRGDGCRSGRHDEETAAIDGLEATDDPRTTSDSVAINGRDDSGTVGESGDTSHPDGSGSMSHPDGSSSTNHPDGSGSMSHPDGSSSTNHPDGSSSTNHPDVDGPYVVGGTEIIDAIDDVFYVLDEEGAVLRWNEAFAEVTGYRDDEIREMAAPEFFGEKQRGRIEAAIEETFEAGENRIESAFRTAAGEHIPYEFVAKRLDGAADGPIIVGIGRDITERRKRERELRERERELSTLMDNVPGMVYRARNERDWPFEFVSEGCRAVTGYAPEALESGRVNWGGEVIVDDNAELWETVQAALDADEPFEVTYRIEAADGTQRWVWEQGRGVFDDQGELDALEGVILDITDRKTTERELDRTRTLLQQAGRIARVGGWELDVTEDQPEMFWTDELYDIHDVPPETTIDIETTLSLYHPDDRADMRRQFERAMETGEGYDMEARALTVDGEVRWVRAIGEAIREDGEVVLLRGSIQDVTEAKERELALEALQETTTELLGADSVSDVVQLVFERAEAVLDAPGIAIYLLDDETNHLEPAAFSSGFVDCCGEPNPVAVDRGDSTLWNAFIDGERTVVDAGAAAEAAVFGPDVEAGSVTPIGDYGVFVVASSTGPIDDDRHRLVETLAATTTAALDRLESERLVRDRESELAGQNRRLRRQVQINDIIRSIHTSLIGSESQAEIERAVCERLVEAEHVEFAWIGTVDASGGEIEPRAWAGREREYLDEVSLAVGDGAEPAVLTARTGESTVVGNVVEELGTDDWRQRALRREFHSIVSVPLFFDEFSAGVLTVYSGEPNAFDDLERTVFAELGESIADSITAVNTRQALYGDRKVELTLRLDGDSFLTRLRTAAETGIEYEGIAAGTEDGSRLFFTASASETEAVLAALEEFVSVTEARVINEADGTALFEATVTAATVPEQLASHGGRLQSVRVGESGLEVVVDVSATTDVREFLGVLHEEYVDVELLAKRTVERSVRTRQEFLDYLLEDVTERQLEVLETAYYAGFFEWPRTSTGEEVADLLDVSQPTVNRHLRLSQQRLLDALFGDTGPE